MGQSPTCDELKALAPSASRSIAKAAQAQTGLGLGTAACKEFAKIPHRPTSRV